MLNFIAKLVVVLLAVASSDVFAETSLITGFTSYTNTSSGNLITAVCVDEFAEIFSGTRTEKYTYSYNNNDAIYRSESRSDGTKIVIDDLWLFGSCTEHSRVPLALRWDWSVPLQNTSQYYFYAGMVTPPSSSSYTSCYDYFGDVDYCDDNDVPSCFKALVNSQKWSETAEASNSFSLTYDYCVPDKTLKSVKVIAGHSGNDIGKIVLNGRQPTPQTTSINTGFSSSSSWILPATGCNSLINLSFTSATGLVYGKFFILPEYTNCALSIDSINGTSKMLNPSSGLVDPLVKTIILWV